MGNATAVASLTFNNLLDGTLCVIPTQRKEKVQATHKLWSTFREAIYRKLVRTTHVTLITFVACYFYISVGQFLRKQLFVNSFA